MLVAHRVVAVAVLVVTGVSALWAWFVYLRRRPAGQLLAHLLVLAFFVFMMWRERRSEIDAWSTRSRVVFYGAAVLVVADIAASIVRGITGPDALAFFLVLGLSGLSMWRVWRDEHTYSR